MPLFVQRVRIRPLCTFFLSHAHTSQALAYLADVLDQLPLKGVLARQHRDLLCDFILSRISNGAEGLGHCARGLRALDRMGQFDQAKVWAIVETLLDNTSPLVQVKQQSERYSVLVLLDSLLAKHRDSLRSLHEDNPKFMERFVMYFDGEKDPRNLMLVFSILLVPMVEWDISANAQDLFDAVFNYFPITFKPPPDDPYGITAQDLKDRLRDCISASGHFAPYAFPALLDKLDSTSINVKRDVLQAITACAANYGPATINLYSVTLWDALKFEILNVQEEDLAEEALTSLHQIAQSLSTSAHDGPVANYLKPIVKECNEHLEDAPTKQSTASGRILAAVSRASLEVSSKLLRGVLPQIYALFQSAETVSRRRGLLEVLNKLIDANADLFGQWRKQEMGAPQRDDAARHVSTRPATNAFADYSERCVDVLMGALTASPVNEVSYRMLGLEGLRGIARIGQLLTDSVISRIIRVLDDIVISEESYGKDQVKTAAMDALVEIAHQKPQLVIETAVPAFMAQLPDSDAESNTPYMPVLEAFAKLSAEPQIFSTITVRLKNKLYAALRQQASTEYVLAVLSAILYGFRRGAIDLASPAVFGPYYQDILIPFLQNICASADELFPNSAAVRDGQVLDIVGRICNAILRPQPWVSQTEVCRNIYTLFRPGVSEDYPPFQVSSPDNVKLVVSTHLLAALQRQASPHPDNAALLTSLIAYASAAETGPHVRSTAIAQISLLTNKFLPAKATSTVISPLLTPGTPTSLLDSTSSPSPTNLRIAFAILRALVLRTDPALATLLPNFLSLLSHPVVGTAVAHALAQVLAPDELLTKDNNCIVYALHKQRFFALVVPALLDGYRAAAQSQDNPSTAARATIKENYLAALAGTTQHVPYALLTPDLPRLVPLLLQSLALDDKTVKASVLGTLGEIVVKDAGALSEHLGSLVGRLLDVASSATKQAASLKGENGQQATVQDPPRTRAAALVCLTAFVGNVKEELLLPWQKLVVRRLWSGPLDDPKRDVRREAVKCRSAWSGLSGGDSDDD